MVRSFSLHQAPDFITSRASPLHVCVYTLAALPLFRLDLRQWPIQMRTRSHNNKLGWHDGRRVCQRTS